MGEDPTQSHIDESVRPTVSASQEPAGSRSKATVPSRLGRYAVLRVLGEGGMGTVYEAEQDSPRRIVALKVIRAGYLSADLLRRFAQESQVLGRLQHHGIAQVYDAGTITDERGREQPYFAMEFVRGVPLTDFAAGRRLGTRDRLALIAKICDAVAHAHQKGVIHRDLKPGNILVDESDQPRILDFGVARATDSDLQATTIQTDIGQLVGAVPYMSPEQIGGIPAELDTRSDVYALGVILYELLAGRPPYDLRKKRIHEAARIIREEEPARLSSVSRTLRGDMETIVARALEKDKARRYQSAEALGADIRRYLRDEPISARPASTWYQVQKFSRRNRALVAGVCAVFVVLVAGLAGTLWQAAEARSESRRADERAKAAEEERAKAEKVVECVQNALLSSDPYSSGTQGITVADALLQAAAALNSGDLKDQPMVEAQLRFTIADIMTGNGRPDEAIEVARRGLEIVRSLYTEDHTDLARAQHWFATYLDNRGRCEEALALFEAAHAMQVRMNGPVNDEVAGCLSGIASCLATLGRVAEALAVHEEVLSIYERLGELRLANLEAAAAARP